MLTLSDMNPCGLSLIAGYPGVGSTTILRLMIYEAEEPISMIDLEEENWTDLRPDAAYYSDIWTPDQIQTLVRAAPKSSTIFVNGLNLIRDEDKSFFIEDLLQDLKAAAKEKDLRIICTLQMRTPPARQGVASENQMIFSELTEGHSYLLQDRQNFSEDQLSLVR